MKSRHLVYGLGAIVTIGFTYGSFALGLADNSHPYAQMWPFMAIAATVSFITMAITYSHDPQK